ncbi:tRNA-dihydrouridine synthase [Candidatus Uhrbacteria bacterium]|nr:tRNA-dihydrouridine synthase [Candidatus Uhrbacteria bacterium]
MSSEFNFWTKLPRPILALAPMAGVTDAAFRVLCKDFGADVIYTEFASTDALIHGNEATRRMIQYDPREQPVVCQVFGNDPEKFEKAAKILEQLGFSGIDINFGCPAYKVVTHGGGVALMREPNRCREIIDATIRAVKIPVSVKIRASIKSLSHTSPGDVNVHHQEMYTAVDLVRTIHDLPMAALMIHGRTFEKPFDGAPDVNAIADVKKAFKGIVIANGGIHSPEDAERMLVETGADGVGIARGAWGKPWIFRQIKSYLASKTYDHPTWDAIVETIIQHAELALSKKSQSGIIELRKHLAWYAKGIPNASALRQALVQVKTVEDITRILKQ